MTSPPAPDSAAVPESPIRRFFHDLFSLFSLPAAFWIINIVYTLDGFAYFGVLVRLTPFLANDVHVADRYVTWFTGTFAAAVTLFMFGFGSYSERFGVRRSLIASFFILTVGRAMLCLTPFVGSHGMALLVVSVSLALMAIGEGVLQTANYSGLKQYSNERTSTMAFAFNYGIFQFGIMAVGFASPEVRTRVAALVGRAVKGPLPADFWGRLAALTRSGEVAVFLMCTVVTALTLLLCLVWMTRRVEAHKLRPEDEHRIREQRRVEAELPLAERLAASPFANLRFTYFVFILLPARTLFAHQIHTISLYIERSYPQWVQDRNEWFSNVVNPLVVFIAGPIVGSLTRRVNIYRTMVVGTLVTALPTFLLCLGDRWELLLAYLVIFSLGEALWQPRFYQYAADLAPEGKMGAYMAAANIPWLLAKWTTGWYAGYMLEWFCPAKGEHRTAVLWGIYGAIAMISPLGLALAGPWLRAAPVKPAGAPAAAG